MVVGMAFQLYAHTIITNKQRNYDFYKDFYQNYKQLK